LSESLLEYSSLGLSQNEKLRILALYIVIGVATVAGFAALFVVSKFSVQLAAFGTAAYVFGLRHGVDADHIVAIDNTTRKLMQDGERPLTVGTWFSLGHSTVVVGLIIALVLAISQVQEQIPVLKSSGAIIGTAASGVFLFLIGLINVVIVLGIYQTFKTLRQGHLDEAELESLLENRGFLNRYFRGLFAIVRKPWQIYPIGVLFGLGFDTASEIALIALTLTVGLSQSIPLWMVLLLPFLFTCGMVLVDTSDSVAMRAVYGWAFLKPLRKIYYNLTITLISVVIAFAIGGLELLQVLSSELNLNGPFWSVLANLNFETMGIAIIGVFLASWLVSIAVWKYKRYDELLV
jgi:high-affinity nickel-transport protein